MTAQLDRSSALTTGRGWGRLETHAGEEFRWIDNDAILHIAVLRNMEYRVDLHLESGPSQSVSPLEISVIDEEAGQSLAVLKIIGRQRVAFALPVGKPRVYRLRFHVATHGEPVDGRVLNFRVFGMGVRPIPSDIVAPTLGFGVGMGWGRLEVFAQEFFRWVENDAIVDVRDGARFPLHIEIEGGPGLRHGARLTVVDEADDRPIFETELGGRRLLAIEQGSFAPPGRLRFHVDGGGEASASDSRILNFRAFESPSLPLD